MKSGWYKLAGILIILLAFPFMILLSLDPWKSLRVGEFSDDWFGPIIAFVLGILPGIWYYKIGKSDIEQGNLVKWALSLTLIFLCTIPFLFLEWLACSISGPCSEFGNFPPLSSILIVPGFLLYCVGIIFLIINWFKNRSN